MFKRMLHRELVLLLLLVFTGFSLVPIAIYLVGSEIFGSYANNGFIDFYRSILSNLVNGQSAALLLLFSPYLVWQQIRLGFSLFHRLSPSGPQLPDDTPTHDKT